MIFQSKLLGLQTPADDVFNYVFSRRNDYPRDRVLYQMDDTNETLTLEQLEEQSRKFAYALVTTYSIKTGDVVAILASDTVSGTAASVSNNANNFAVLMKNRLIIP